MNSNKKIYLIIFIAFAAVVLAASAYAFYVNDIAFQDAEFGVNTTTAQESVFTASSSGTIAFKGTPKDVGQYSISTTPILTSNASIQVELSSSSDYETTQCTYDVVWNYTSSDMYTESDVELPHTTSMGTFPYELSIKINDNKEIDLSDFTWDNGKAIIMDDVVIASADLTKTTQVWDIVVNMYNIDAEQTKVFDKTFAANIEVVSNGCVTNEFSDGEVHAYAFDISNNSYSELSSLPSAVDLYSTTLSSTKTTCVKGGTYTESSGVPSGDECYAIYDVTYPVDSLATVLSNKTTTSVMASNNAWGIVSENGIRYEGSDYVTPTGGNATSIVTCAHWNSCTFTGDSKSGTYTTYRAAAEEAVAQGVLEDSGMSNYVCFDSACTDGKYRIIGAFNETYDADGDGTAETTGYLTKLIRNELIKNNDGSVLVMAFEADNVGYWIGSDMETYLHGTYADSLSSTAKGYAVPVTYHLGNVTWNANVNTQYAEERGTAVHTGRLASDVATYGLIYPSDYGYAVLTSDCVRTTSTGYESSSGSTIIGSGYYVTACTQENWMHSTGLYNENNWWWNISPQVSGAAYVFFSSNYGYVSNTSASNGGGAVRPSWYLRPETKIVSGVGTEDSPYILGL